MSATRRIRLLALAVCTLAIGGLGVTASPAEASKKCGKEVIDQYFFSGRIKYHPQECYASALKQIDPDARMYSGIMGAIRAARARDRAKDAQAASGGDDTASGGSVAPSDGGGPPPSDPGDTGVPVEPIEPLPVDDLPVEVPDAVDVPTDEATAISATAGEAAAPMPTIDGVVPLPVAILMGLAGLVTLVGAGGLTVRWLDGPR